MKRSAKTIKLMTIATMILVMGAVLAVPAAAFTTLPSNVQSTPSVVRITGTGPVMITMTHVVTITGPPVADLIEASTFAEIYGNDIALQAINTVPVRIALTGNTATFRETIVVNSSSIQAALTEGSGIMGYLREFLIDSGTGFATSSDADVPFQISFQSQTIGSLGVRRMDLYFQEGSDRVTEITVPRGTQGLAAWAEVEIDGSGYLEGQWLVDGRVIERVREYASYGQKVTLSTSTIPGISTFSPGLHTVQLQITDPVPPFEAPQLVYLVTEKAQGASVPIAVESPVEGASVTPETRFAWTATPRAVVYIATWWRAFDSRKVLSAMVKEGSYRAPEALFAEKFVPGVKYTWQVKGYDGDGRLVSSGPVGSFIAR